MLILPVLIPTPPSFPTKNKTKQNMQDRLVPLLEDGISVLIYAGDADFICNW